jgi:cytoskeletal protein CcmA (bactofilin family)
MANRIQLRRDGAQQWANVNPILAQGELGIEIDTSRIKIGDGVTAWNSLRYERPIETESNTANTLVKRDADGNFEAGAITGSLVGNSATATRLANARQIALGGDMSGAGTFDGSSNLTITAELNYVVALPHYDENDLAATGTYTRITVDSRGRIIDADNPTTLTDFGIADAQPLDSDLSSLANMTTFGMLSRQAEGTIVSRTITGGSGRIIVQNGNAQTSNPFLDLADTTVVVGKYNPISAMDPLVNPLISATTGAETVNTVNLQVDRYGRLIYANTSPIATATQGAKDGTSFTVYDNSTAYPRFSKIIASNGRTYQAAIRDIPAGLGEPSHNTQQGDSDDQGGWRDLGTDGVEQKGIASFDQEDFDVDANGHVTIAENAIENSQLQSLGRLMFTDQNATETFELDPERTTDNAYHGITAINHVNINNRTGGSVFRVTGYDTAEYPFQPGILDQGNSYPSVAADDPNGNGSADWGSSFTGLIDINLDTTISGNITLDVTKTNQFIKRTSGNVDFHLEVNEAEDRNMNVTANNTNAGGTANINITADNEITISSTDAAYFVNVEDYRFQYNVLSTRDATMVLDPGDDDAATGLVQIRGDLQVDGVTTTVNSVVMTVQDPIITLGGEDTLVADDNKDRGIEFRYYDSQERFGFYGWDEDYADSNIWSDTGGYRFLYNATNSNEVFSGTDAPIIAGNLRLTTNTSSTWKTPTTGTLVVTGGTGISENLNVGGTTHLNGNVEIDGTVDIDANFAVRNNTTDKFTIESATGNTVIEGTVDIQLETEITDNLIVTADNKEFIIRTAGSVNKFTVDTDNGNTDVQGTLHVVQGVDFDSTLNVDSDVTFNATLDVDDDVVFHNDFLMDVTGKYLTITNGIDQKFRIESTNGNTDIEGSLNIGGFNTFERTNNIVIATTDSDITLSSNGNATFAGGVNMDKDLRVGGDIYLADRLVVKDAGVARTRPSLLNNVDVLYRTYMGGGTAHNASFADDADAQLRVAGGVGIVQDLHVGDDFYVGKVNTNDTVEFSILGESGFTTIGRVGQGNATDGAILVHGYATFNEQFTINGPLTTIGDANTDVFTVNAVTTFTDDVTVDGSLLVNTNATIEGNLTVNGVTTTVNSTVVTLDDPIITLGGDTAPTSNDAKDRGVEFRYYDSTARVGFFGWDNSASRYALYHNATNSSEAFNGSRSGLDAGSIKLFDTTNATNSASGTFIVGGGAGIGLDLYVGDDLFVTDNGSFGGNVDITGTLDVTDDFAVASTFTVDAQTGNTFANGTFTVNGNAAIGNQSSDSHTVNGTVQFNQALTGAARANIRDLKIGTDAANEIGTLSGNLILDSAGGTVNITDNADVDGNLNVDGNTQIDGTLTVDGNTTIGDDAADTHVITGTVQANQLVTAVSGLYANDIRLGSGATGGSRGIYANGGSLVLDSSTNNVQVSSDFVVTGAAQLRGNNTIGDGSTDTHTVNGPITFNQAITSTDITADNVKIGVDGASEISTVAGNLTLDSNGGTVIIDDNATVSGTLVVSDQTTINDTLLIDATNENFVIRSSLVDRFTVDTDNGNTFIAGTTQIEGLTTINDNVDINGNADVSGTSTLGDIVSITDTTNASTGSSFSASGALRVAGGATIAKDFVVGEDFKVYGNFEVDGNVVQKGNQEFRGRVEFTKNETATRLTGNCAIMVPNGGAAVYEDSFFGANVFIGPDQNETITFFGATGNITADGTITSATVAATTANIVTINTTSNVNVGGSIIVNTNKFIVSGATGNTDIAGTLDVAGRTIIDDTLQVTQNVDFDSDLNVDGNQQLDGTLTVDSTSLFKDSMVLRGASKTLKLQNGGGTDKITLHSTSGNAEITGTSTLGTLAVTNNTTMGGTLGVTGQITGDVTGDLTGTADKSNLVDVTETATSNLTYFPAFVSSNNGFTEIRTDSANLTYNPSDNRLTVANFRSTTNFEVQGNLNVTGTLSFFQSEVSSIANHDTDALTEGTSNLYFTDERVDDRVAALVDGGTGISATYNDAGNLLSLAVDFSEINTDNLTEGSTNIFFTQARTRNAFTYGTGIQHDGSGTISVTQSDINTDNLTEGSTNIFFTNARARGAFSASGDLGYNASTGVFSFTQRTDAQVNGLADTRIALQVGANLDLSNQDTGDLAEGTNLYYTNARADARIALQVGANLDISNQSTSDLSEGTNLYYTDARADARASAAITALGLGTAATTDATAYATAAQGALADSATQPGDLATVATSGSYNDLANLPTLFSGAYADLTGTPTISAFGATLIDDADADAARTTLGLGTAATTNSTAYATAAQGALADSALQSETIDLTTLKATVAASADFADFQTRIAAL